MIAPGLLQALLLTGRLYHPVRPLAALAASEWPHVAVCGRVVYVRHQQDGDWHLSVADASGRIVVEIIPLIPLRVPPRGALVVARGIPREDKGHGWWEVHPAESLDVVRACPF